MGVKSSPLVTFKNAPRLVRKRHSVIAVLDEMLLFFKSTSTVLLLRKKNEVFAHVCPRSSCVQIEGLIRPDKWDGSGSFASPLDGINVNGDFWCSKKIFVAK